VRRWQSSESPLFLVMRSPPDLVWEGYRSMWLSSPAPCVMVCGLNQSPNLPSQSPFALLGDVDQQGWPKNCSLARGGTSKCVSPLPGPATPVPTPGLRAPFAIFRGRSSEPMIGAALSQKRLPTRGGITTNRIAPDRQPPWLLPIGHAYAAAAWRPPKSCHI
jgi:hypothetical protein